MAANEDEDTHQHPPDPPPAPLDEVATVSCGTTAGEIVLEFHRQWSPHGYDRAVRLFEASFYDESHFFRTVPGFLVQFGMSYTKDAALKHLANTQIPDDPQLNPPIRFTKGTISYAGSGPDSRTSQLFISLMADGGSFGTQLWETPIGKVVSGMDTVTKFYSGYGDMPPWGKGPIQQNIREEGIAYMQQNFPLIDSFYECHVKRTSSSSASASSADKKTHEDHKDPMSARGRTDHKQHDHVHQIDAAHDDPHGRPSNIRTTHQSHKQHHDEHNHHNGGGAGGGVNEPAEQHQQQRVAGEMHHQHSVHFNAAPNEEGLTKLSWELVGSCLLLFVVVIVLWLRIALRVSPPAKSRKTS